VPRARTTTVPAALAAVAVLGLTACGGGAGSDTGASVASGDPSACPGDVVDVVVSVGQWGDVVRGLAGDCATVTTIIASGAIDPHDFDPSTADLAAFSGADLVVLNGAGYDHWAEDAVAAADPGPAVVSAADVAGVPDAGADPHLWYDPTAVQRMSAAVTRELSRLSPDAAPYLGGQADAWQAELQPYLAAVAQLRSTATGHTYAATETVFDRMAAAVGLTDVTPAGYRRSASNGSEPAPGELTAFEAALADGTVDVLVYNTQTSGNVPEQLRSAAEDADVPVVEVTESPADAMGSFVAWQLDQLEALSEALGGTS
jgi:zinc/manganese transport system substrate-binding protein